VNEITRVQLIGFQSHKISTIDPAPAGSLTVLVGASDTGKTAILRALRWTFYNVPQGCDFIQVGANAARVSLDYADGCHVVRTRSNKGFNRYEIGDQDNADPQRFEGFGNSVPLEVQEITGVRPIQIGDMILNINLADQLSGPFLGSSISAPARAKVLGKLAGTEEVDYAARGVSTDLYRRRQDKDRLSVDMARLTAAIGEYAYLEELGEQIGRVDALLLRVKTQNEKLDQLKRLQGQYASVAQQLWDTEKLKVYLSNIITYADLLIDDIGQTLDRHTRLQDLSSRWNKSGVLLVLENLTLDHTSFVGEAELLHSCAAKRLNRYSALDRNWAALASIYLQKQTIKATLDATQHVEDAVIRARMLQDDITLLGRLHGVSGRYASVTQGIMLLDMRINKLSGIDEAAAVLDAAHDKHYRQSNLRLRKDFYEQNINRIRLLGGQAQQFTADEQRLAKEYRTTLLAAGVCPTCGSQITSQILKEAI